MRLLLKVNVTTIRRSGSAYRQSRNEFLLMKIIEENGIEEVDGWVGPLGLLM
jgi:hypothetical protein